MNFPPSFWLNRKSKNGHRSLSRVPRAHRLPAWRTEPPTSLEVIVDPEILKAMRRILRGVTVLVTGNVDTTDKVAEMVEGFDDSRLVAVAQEAFTNLKRRKSYYFPDAEVLG